MGPALSRNATSPPHKSTIISPRGGNNDKQRVDPGTHRAPWLTAEKPLSGVNFPGAVKDMRPSRPVAL